jgi:hypothetical protein
MDASMMQLVDQAKTWLSVIGTVVIGASLLTSWSKTPPPNTRLGRIYHYIELAALLFGRAKEMGVLPATPATDRAVAQAVALASQNKGPPTM